MGCWLLLIPLVLTSAAGNGGQGFAFCRTTKPVSLPNSEQLHCTENQATKLLFIHLNIPPSYFCDYNCRLRETAYKQQEKNPTQPKLEIQQKTLKTTKLLFHYYCTATLESEKIKTSISRSGFLNAAQKVGRGLYKEQKLDCTDPQEATRG